MLISYALNFIYFPLLLYFKLCFDYSLVYYLLESYYWVSKSLRFIWYLVLQLISSSFHLIWKNSWSDSNIYYFINTWFHTSMYSIITNVNSLFIGGELCISLLCSAFPSNNHIVSLLILCQVDLFFSLFTFLKYFLALFKHRGYIIVHSLV